MPHQVSTETLKLLKEELVAGDKFVVIPWPHVQELMDDSEEFQDNAVLINHGKLYEEYGDSAYLVSTEYIKKKLRGK